MPDCARDATPYLLDNAMRIASERLTLLAQIHDPFTRGMIARTGLAPGWRCWEVGAGQGSIARWMLAEVGSAGRVVASDLDPRLIDPRPAGLEVMTHDVVCDPAPTDTFDLVHTRLLLCHLPERDAVLERLAAALVPGGWLVVEDFDSLSLVADPRVSPDETALATQAAVRELFRRHGVDLRYGRRLPGRMRRLGFSDIYAEGRVNMWQKGTIHARFARLTFEQMADALLREGLVSEQRLARDVELLDFELNAPSPTLWSVIGRKPG